jgi:creatinine amidohydrolase/Fe(II)-dependent formamide hydrolase-like protein
MKAMYPYPTGGAIPRIEAEIGRELTDVEKEALSTGGEHAAVMETSLLLAYKPELVEESYQEYGMDGPPRVPSIAAIGTVIAAPMKLFGMKAAAKTISLVFDTLAKSVGWGLNSRNGYGGHEITYTGNPSAASPELGRTLRKLIARDILAIVDDVIEGRARPNEVHSIFWKIPILRTNFSRNLKIAGAVLLALILALIVF